MTTTFSQNKTSPLLVCGPVSCLFPPSCLRSPSTLRLRRRRRFLAGTLNGPRRRRALLRPYRGGGLPRLPRPPRGHDQGPHQRYATVARSFVPDFACLPIWRAASPVLTCCLVWWFAQMWRSSTSCATPVSPLDLLGRRVGAADSHLVARVRAFGRPCLVSRS